MKIGTGFARMLVGVVLLSGDLSQVHAVGASGLSTQMMGVKALGQANAFVAQADDPSANYFNPAGLVQLEGWQGSIGATGLEVNTDYKGLAGSGAESLDSSWALLPNVFATGSIPLRGTNRLSIGFGLSSPFGSSAKWADGGFARYVTTESKLETIHYNPSVAYAFNESLSVGVGVDYLQVSDLSLESKINQSLVGGLDGSQKLAGDGGQWGYNGGVLWKATPRHAFGATYRSQFQVHIEGDVELRGLDPLIQAAYNFPAENYRTGVKTDLTFPQSATVGWYFVPSDKWTLLLDYEWTDWSVFDETRLTFDETDGFRSEFLNTGNPVQRRWRDVHAFALGSQYNFSNGIKLRSGYAYMNSAVPTRTWDPSIPDANQHTIATGLGYTWGNLTVDAAYNVILFEHRGVSNSVGNVFGASVNGDYRTLVNVVGLSFTYKFLGRSNGQ